MGAAEDDEVYVNWFNKSVIKPLLLGNMVLISLGMTRMAMVSSPLTRFALSKATLLRSFIGT